MAKKLIDITEEVRSKEKHFTAYLKNLLDKEVFDFLMELSQIDNLYLFSGIIRNYFIGINEARDVDIMIDSTKDLSAFISKYKNKKNSYGGYKIFISGMTIDLWYLQDTWALRNSQKVLEFELEKYIPSTAFFNFSSILFSFKNHNFIYTKHFLRFLRDKKIDYVFEPNANYALCVVNTLYYQDKLKLSLTDNLRSYILKLYTKVSNDYEKVQEKHFGRILYSENEIAGRIKQIHKDLQKALSSQENSL